MQRTDSEVLSMLEMKFQHKYKCAQILSWCKKMSRLKFLEKVFASVVESGKNGTYLHIGSDRVRNPDPKVYIPLFGPNMNDNEGADKFCNVVRCNKGNMNCRICFCRSSKFWDVDELRKEYGDSEFSRHRDSPLCEALGRRHQEIWLKWMRRGPQYLTKNETKVLMKAKEFNIGNIDNPLFGFYRFHEKHKVATIYQMNPPDVLHTVLKGNLIQEIMMIIM